MWSFLNPAFLAAAAAAIIPLILHLMQRRRTVRTPFSTIRFLKLAQKRSSNRIRMENFLLWLLRTLLLLVIAAAFAVPVLRTTKLGRLIGQAHRDVALVLDVSYSMNYETGQRRVWDDVRNAALALLHGLQDGDRVSVILAADEAVPLIEKPNVDLAMVEHMLENLEPRTGSSHLHEAAAAALETLTDSTHREREVYLLTDGQALPWNGFNPTNTVGASTNNSGAWDPNRVDKNIAFFALLAGPHTPENCWPADVSVSPSVLMSKTAATLSARIARTGPAAEMAVTLTIDDREAGRRVVSLDANGVQSVAFALPTLAPGIHTCAVATPTDALTLDDTFHLLLRIREQLPSLCVGGEQDALFLMTALNPGSEASPTDAKRLDPGELDEATLRAYSSIFLVNALPLPGQTMLALENYVKAGGTLVIFPGDNAEPAAYRDWNVLPAKPTEIAELPQDSRVRQLRLLLMQDPLFSGFTLPPGATPTLAIRRMLRWPKLEPDSTTVIAAGNYDAFLVSRYVGKGRVLLCSVSAVRRWSSLPMTSFFLPLIHQMVEFGAGLSREPLFIWTTPNLVVSDVLPDFTEGDQLLAPSGRALTVRPVRQGAQISLEAEGVDEPGVYLLSGNGGAKTPALAVNVARAESNLEPINPDSLSRVTGLRDVRVARDLDDLQRQIDEYRRGRPLTETFFWLALALAIAEWWMANRVSRNRSAAVSAVAVEASGRVSGPASS